MSTAPSNPSAPEISGKIVVIGFVIFVVVGIIISVVLARQMRPATMAAKAMAMPLAGTVLLECLDTDHSNPVSVRVRGTCPQSGQLSVALPDAGSGVKTLSYVLLGAEGAQPPMGQIPPTGHARIDLKGTGIGTRVALFIYADGPLPLPEIDQALQAAPEKGLAAQMTAVEKFANRLMRDPKQPREIRTARVELKVTE
jgi:hypothetical protein